MPFPTDFIFPSIFLFLQFTQLKAFSSLFFNNVPSLVFDTLYRYGIKSGEAVSTIHLKILFPSNLI